MKNLIYLFLVLGILSSCEDVVDIEIPNAEPKLVIDASFEYYTNEDPVEFEGGVRLSLSAPFFADTITPVSEAEVFITNLVNDQIIRFRESFENGYYIPSSSGFFPEFGTDYELSVIYNNETYKATTQLIPTVPIDNVERGDATLFEGDEREVIITFTDDGSREDYYLFDFDFNLYLPSEDRFYQGTSFPFSYFYEDVEDGEMQATIKILGITKQYFTYLNLLIQLSGQDGGSPFQAPPATLRGNIINTTNPDNFALGYFNMSEADRVDFVISEN